MEKLTENCKMESAGLGRRISGAIRRMMEAPIIDEKVVDLCLKEIKLALFQTDVPFSLVHDLQINVKKNTVQHNFDKQMVLQSIFDELCKTLDPGKLPPPLLERLHYSECKNNKSFVKLRTWTVMFVGLQGSGKTKACTQFANYYKKKGFHPAIVSADTFRASNFDHLMQSTSSSIIPLYGSFMQSDPVAKTALSGVNWSLKRSKDFIIIDTSERHAHISSLIKEMSQVYEATKPDLVIFVVDSHIGQAAFHQVQLFKQSVQVGGVIMTNANYDRKGGEAFSAIAAAKTPILFIGRGEGLEEFEDFNIKPFLIRLLGLQQMLGFNEDVIVDEDLDIHTNYNFRVYHMFKHISQGPEWMKEDRLRTLRILNSMKYEELDACLQNLLSCSFILRIAKTSGVDVGEVLLLLEDHKIVVDLFDICDCTSYPACEFFDKIFPGVMMDNPAIRKKIEAGEDIDKPTKEELLEISKSRAAKPWDSKRIRKFKLQRKRVYGRYKDENETLRQEMMAKEKKRKREMEDEAAELAALYGKGKPLEAKREDVEDSKMNSVFKVEANNYVSHLLNLYCVGKQLSKSCN